jgi:hypothetical protein
LLASLDQKIADAESQLLQLLSVEDMHSAVEHLADLYARRKKLEARLKQLQAPAP